MTLQDLSTFFQEKDHFILTSHESPDGDGLGAMYALLQALRKLGKNALALVSEPLALKYAFLDKKNDFKTIDDPESQRIDVSDSTLVVLDTNDVHYAGRVADVLLDRVRDYLLIDHHESHGIDPEKHLLDPGASSTCEIAYDLLRMLKIPLDLDIATALYAGIVYDTGSFSYPKTNQSTFACALELVKAGVRPYTIHNLLYESSSVASLLLRKRVLSTLELHVDNSVAIQIMLRSDLADSGAAYEESEDLINVPLRSETVQVSVFFKENSNGVLRCSLRSKGAVNVAHIAQGFGGGGHRTAAGFKCVLPLEKARKSVLDKLTEALSESGAERMQ